MSLDHAPLRQAVHVLCRGIMSGCIKRSGCRPEHVPCRLVVRRVKRLQPTSHDGSTRGELFAAYWYHAFVTNSAFSNVHADEHHRDHAIIEQVIAELKAGPLTHLPCRVLHRERGLAGPRGPRVQPRPWQPAFVTLWAHTSTSPPTLVRP